MALGADDIRNYLLHGNFDPSKGCLVSLRALQKAAVPAQNLILVIPSHPAKGLIDIHQRAVWQIWVCNGNALQRHTIISCWQRISMGPAQSLPSQLNSVEKRWQELP